MLTVNRERRSDMKNLSVKAEQIYDILKSKATSQDKDGHFCIYPRKQLAINCGVNEKTVQRALNELEQNGYILRKKGGCLCLFRIFYNRLKIKKGDIYGLHNGN